MSWRDLLERYPWMQNRHLMALTALYGALMLTYGLLGRIRISGMPPNGSSKRHSNHNNNEMSVIRKLAASDAPNVLNIHVVPHTHDDAGWRKTVEQYYRGSNDTIDDRGAVRQIITTVVQALTEHESRTFVYAEMKFFSMWWAEQSDAVRDTVRFLIANRQLSFVNGGWCMHDEAASHFVGMVDQTTTGHHFLLRELGVVPRSGWQLDPFGHSATQASLLSASVGFDALFFGRIDYQDLNLRHRTSQCEGLWDASSTDDSTIFWGLTGSYGGNYGPPAGFMFDSLFHDELLVGLNETRLKQRVRTFLTAAARQSNRTQGNHILMTMGSDFTFKEAHIGFSNYDLLIGTIMNYQRFQQINVSDFFGSSSRFDRVNIFYSNPDYFTAQKYKETVKARKQRKQQQLLEQTFVGSSRGDESVAVNWTTKTDDFFPYSDSPNSFWTGYFTSRSGLKRFERVASSLLLAARQIDALPEPKTTPSGADVVHDSFINDKDEQPSPLFALEDAVGVAQHHDAVSGTSKQHVADDYSLRLANGVNRAALHVTEKLRRIMLKAASSPNNQTDTPQQQQLSNLGYCPLLNETVCPISEDATAKDDIVMYVIVYNPLASNRSSVVRLPVASDDSFRVERIEEGGHTEASVIRAVTAKPLCANFADIKHVLTFATGDLPPAGTVAFRIAKEPTPPEQRIEGASVLKVSQDKVELENGVTSAMFDGSTGLLTGLKSADGAALAITQTWGYYQSFDNTIDEPPGDPTATKQNSGAYIFRPSTPNQTLKVLKAKENSAVIVNTSVGYEVHASFEEPWIQQVTRVTRGMPYIEVEYTVGPIPIEDGRGKEIISRFSAPAIHSNGRFYTDSNGREFQERRRNYRPTWDLQVHEPVAGNYYPVNAAIYIEDANASLALLVDRSQGGSSLFDGSIELMVQRRTLADDSRGVDEPLNETLGGMTPYPPYGNNERVGDGVVFRGTHRIMIGSGSVGASLARSEMDGAFAEPLVFVGSWPASDPVVFEKAAFSGLQANLPDNVMLVTLMRLTGRKFTTFLLRLGHQYGAGEDAVLSQPVSVNLSCLLSGYNVTAVAEKTLSGNQDLARRLKHRLDWTGKGSHELRIDDFSSTNITLSPMQIRTFELVTDLPSSGQRANGGSTLL